VGGDVMFREYITLDEGTIFANGTTLATCAAGAHPSSTRSATGVVTQSTGPSGSAAYLQITSTGAIVLLNEIETLSGADTEVFLDFTVAG
jgi:hypothetical protein